ncbi:hypothetical protein KIN20_008222 [Parelaphostrongylus tenuis]|uniref:Uncharacterized protein n=1 Tax=Parelaphostrongylus tenuis TaxID=148309 RepID=A0AAD5M4I4_PARTN|nr:hypothetical protein KIN20_008222 [Parelaphostrongylus tenuis]
MLSSEPLDLLSSSGPIIQDSRPHTSLLVRSRVVTFVFDPKELSRDQKRLLMLHEYRLDSWAGETLGPINETCGDETFSQLGPSPQASLIRWEVSAALKSKRYSCSVNNRFCSRDNSTLK